MNSFNNLHKEKESERSDLGKVKDGVLEKTDLEVGRGSDDIMGGWWEANSLGQRTRERGKWGGCCWVRDLLLGVWSVVCCACCGAFLFLSLPSGGDRK